jgi:acetyl-CoA carboxylase carboxyl transferase subunit alpha
MSLKVPNISVIIGEGGSGGAIALASSNKVIMLENSIYSVISPEGCASILWRDPGKSLEAAEAMKLSAQELLKLGIIDEIIPEPLGGAHRNHDEIAYNIKSIILENINYFENMSSEEIFVHRKNKFLKIGREGGFTRSSVKGEAGLEFKESIFLKFKRILSQNKYLLSALSIVIIALIIAFLN